MSRDILKELALALALGGLAAASPLTSNRVVPSLLAGAAVGAAIFAYRLRALRQRGESAGRTESAAGSDWGRPGPWGVLLLFGAVAYPTATWMVDQWTSSIWTNSHGVFVPFIMGYLAYLALRADTDAERRASPWGFAFLVPGLLLIALDAGAGTRYVGAVGLVTCLPGLSLLLLGVARTRALVVPLLTGLFMIPIPDTPQVHLPLRSITAAGVEPALRALGFATLRDGTIIEIQSGSFVVADACSGFATVYAGVGLAIILACYASEPWRRAVLLLAALPLALAANVIRVVGLILLTHFMGAEILDTPAHEATGVAAFWLVVIALWFLADTERLRSAPG